MNKLKIVKLDHSYSEQIQKIWIKSLPFNLKSMIGENITKDYISFFLENKINLGVGLLIGKRLVGFVLFGNDKEIIRKLIKRKLSQIIYSFMKSIFYLDLKRFINFLDCSIYILVSKKKEREIVFLNTELLIICISPSEQGKKYGSFLIKESLKNFKEFFSQFNGIFVKTLKKDRQNIVFYEKNNFEKIFEIYGRTYLKFSF
tara:strand:+ start:4204 stop:4809 length:606 start_codon:yes stop_codon:yes gene_type:complete